MTVEELDQRLQSGSPVTLIDVREPEEWTLCHLSGARLEPLSSWNPVPEYLLNPNSVEGPMVVYCHHGMRSAEAVRRLQRAGCLQAVNLEGGIDAWARTIDPHMATY